MDNTILVIGGTGQYLGQPVARHLKDAGFHVRIMSRSLERARGIFDESYEILGGDVLDTLSLKRALEGCWGVHINLSDDVNRQGVENIVPQASKQGLQRIGYVEGIMAVEENSFFPPLKETLLAEKAIRESGIPYTVFCPTFIMETLEWSIQGKQAGMMGKNLPLTHMIAGDDFGRMVAAGYSSEEAANKKFFIYGPEPLSLLDSLKKFCAVLHPEVKKVSAMPFWMARLMAAVTRNKEMKAASEVFAFYAKVGECGDPDEAKRILGAPQTTFDEWLTKKNQVT